MSGLLALAVILVLIVFFIFVVVVFIVPIILILVDLLVPFNGLVDLLILGRQNERGEAATVDLQGDQSTLYKVSTKHQGLTAPLSNPMDHRFTSRPRDAACP